MADNFIASMPVTPLRAMMGVPSAPKATGAVLALLYDYAGDLRDAKTGLLLTVGGSVAMLALLALLITSIAPGHFNLN